MKTNSRTPKNTAAFTLTEAVIVVLIIGLRVAVLLPALRKARVEPVRIRCVNKSKEIGAAFRVFASDNGDRYPLQATNHPYIFQPGGTGTASGAVVSTNAQAWQVYQAMWMNSKFRWLFYARPIAPVPPSTACGTSTNSPELQEC